MTSLVVAVEVCSSCR